MIPPAERCQGEIHDSVSYFPCRNRGRYREEGKLYCGLHAPSRVKARRRERDRQHTARWRAKQRGWQRRDRIRVAEANLLEAVMELDPIPVGLEWLDALILKVRKARNS